MELASRVYDTITNPEYRNDTIDNFFSDKFDHTDNRHYWRRIIRMAALCHDLGHLPFSHGAEKELLPNGWNHEKITNQLIFSEQMKEIWEELAIPLKPIDIAKIAIGPQEFAKSPLSDWEAILSEIITNGSFGVDRMDYLLRDSHHLGVAYGNFDHYRLIDSIRILPPPAEPNKEHSKETTLGIEKGGIQSAETLILARYFMFSQVYFHRVRRIYDIHLRDFLKNWLIDGVFSIKVNEFLELTDNEIFSAMHVACIDPKNKSHTYAKRIIHRNHFKRIYEKDPNDDKINSNAIYAIYERMKEKFGDESIKIDIESPKKMDYDFSVLRNDTNKVVSSLSLSHTLQHIPPANIGYIFVDPTIFSEVKNWLKFNKEDIIRGGEE